MKLFELFHRHSGVVSTIQFAQAGIPANALTRLVKVGTIRRVTRGLYTCPEIPIGQTGRARLLGGAISCITALKEHGFWTPPSRATHLRLPAKRFAAHQRNQVTAKLFASAVTHPTTAEITTSYDGWQDALQCASQCCSRDELVAIIDSARRHQIVATGDIIAACSGSSALLTAWELSDARSDSGVETLVRLRLRKLKLRFSIQHQIGRWRVDFLIGNCLVVEIDGFAYHSDVEAFARDREKDRYLQERGYTVLRFTYWDVMHHWRSCEEQILGFVRANRHRSQPRQ